MPKQKAMRENKTGICVNSDDKAIGWTPCPTSNEKCFQT